MRTARIFAGWACVALGISGVVFLSLAGLNKPQPAWFMLGFEVTVIVAGVLGAMVGFGRITDAPALGMACAAGTIAVAVISGGYSANWALPPIPLKPVFAARVAVALVAMCLGAWCVLGRRPALSTPLLLRGVGCGVVFIAMAGGAWVSRTTLSGLPGWLLFLLGCSGFVVAVGFLAAAVHLCVRAFTIVLDDPSLRSGESGAAA